VLPALTVLTDVLDITPTQANISITTYMVSPPFQGKREKERRGVACNS
jgi:hypothetical protein